MTDEHHAIASMLTAVGKIARVIVDLEADRAPMHGTDVGDLVVQIEKAAREALRRHEARPECRGRPASDREVRIASGLDAIQFSKASGGEAAR